MKKRPILRGFEAGLNVQCFIWNYIDNPENVLRRLMFNAIHL